METIGRYLTTVLVFLNSILSLQTHSFRFTEREYIKLQNIRFVGKGCCQF